MSIWQKIKGFFGGEKKFEGLKEKEEKPLERGLKTVSAKRKDISHAVGMFLLIFVFLVMFSETTLAIISLFFWDNRLTSAFTVPIAIMPALAILLTGAIIWINNQNNKMAGKFVSAFERVSHGDFGYQLEVPKKGQFKPLFENFNKMSKELLSIQTLKDEFIHDFSHEFKTPIASINGFANLLLEGGLTEEEQRQYLKIIADESARLSTLAESTLTLNRLENQQFVGETKPYRLDIQLKDCVIMLQPRWEEKNITLTSSLAQVTYQGNASLMQQVWLNLLTNAIKFTPQGGEIEVTLSAEGRFISVSVSDNGIGMTEEVAAHIFDKYYQGDSSHATKGNGLGLAIAKRIVSMCGGGISVSSRPGEGSTFTVKLPAC